jgi:aarF domain-containing kinase
MLDAHVAAGAAVGVPFGSPGVYDFSAHGSLTKRVSALGATMLQYRLTPPPEAAYALHRRLSGAFLVNIKLKAKVPCSEIFRKVYAEYEFTTDPADELPAL